ncbi:MAG: hypothetical protein KDE19_00410 [Caldilineaceae bacterium]|nr:hypothetical protein [Caldilineaceae bacterium]
MSNNFDFDKRELSDEVSRRVKELLDFCVTNNLPVVVEVCTYSHDNGTETDQQSSSAVHGLVGSMTPAMKGYVMLAKYDSNVQHQSLPLILRMLSHMTEKLTELGN